MGSIIKSGAALALCVALAACGGGGGGGGGGDGGGGGGPTTPPVLNGPPVTGAPTTTLAQSQNTANDLGSSARTQAEALARAANLGSVPVGVTVGPPIGVAIDQTINCPNGGTFRLSGNINGAAGAPYAAGDVVNYSYNNCSYASGVTFSGSGSLYWVRYTSASDFEYIITLNNFRYTSPGFSYGPLNYQARYSFNGGTVSWAYYVDGAAVVGTPVVTTVGTTRTIVQGTIRYNYGGGFVEATFSNFQYDTANLRPIAGTVTVTGSNGTRAVLTATASGYSVTITANGSTTTYTVSY